ncbi:hypothetical protein BFP97_02480 [Roseivirga sp. 4D4]|uniref:hypothetical protein n=1 Tax=Roseivirga sp. 4D4 TaxID=1889784 RepID=UPI000852EF5F|nr:hypothetical protein [Roseivirga sp. 4D4]OEK00444.1 hypothetical protein BFP97_02480 [Roseivirga sp. 4D4]
MKKWIPLIFIFSSLGLDAQINNMRDMVYARTPRNEEVRFPKSVSERMYSADKWHEGTVTLFDEGSVEGVIKYDFVHDAVQVKTGQVIKTFAASQVEKFKIIEQDTDRNRTFYTYLLPTKNEYARPGFFELLVEGEVNLLMRERILVSAVPSRKRQYRGKHRFDLDGNRNKSVRRSITEDRIVNRRSLERELYVISEEGEVKLLKKNRRNVLSFFRERYSEVKGIMKRRRLKLDRTGDIAVLFHEYNQLYEKASGVLVPDQLRRNRHLLYVIPDL